MILWNKVIFKQWAFLYKISSKNIIIEDLRLLWQLFTIYGFSAIRGKYDLRTCASNISLDTSITKSKIEGFCLKVA